MGNSECVVHVNATYCRVWQLPDISRILSQECLAASQATYERMHCI